MLILAADTSGINGSLALVRFESSSSCVLEVVSLAGGNFSAQLVPQISGLLSSHALTKRDIDGYAVASGPGSFTGLRVGLAAIKALAEISQKPIAAVSLLEAVARAAGRDGNILAALDAGRGEIYCANYELRSLPASRSQANLISQQLLTAEEFVAAASNLPIATPDPKIADFARTRNLQVTLIAQLRADAIARLGFEKLQAGEIVSPEALDATYIRRNDSDNDNNDANAKENKKVTRAW